MAEHEFGMKLKLITTEFRKGLVEVETGVKKLETKLNNIGKSAKHALNINKWELFGGAIA